MDATTRKLERIFDQTITYQIPLFQRPYVWTKEANWEPLWEDIEALLDKHFRGRNLHPLFLGAVVLEQLSNQTGSIESRQVIDGQQRFTTLQLFLIAARDLATVNENTKYIDRFSDLVANRRSKIDHDDEIFKVWPTNSNRASFRVVHEAGSPVNVDKAIKENPDLNNGSNNIIDGYRYFHSQLSLWLNGSLDDEGDIAVLTKKSIFDRFETLWCVVKDFLQVVVIDLDKDDETQVIFETLNARGQDLLPADLIKNYLFRKAAADGENVEKLYNEHWQKFETAWWRFEVKQGRIVRPRIDVFINHYLAMMTRDDVKSSHLFNGFKSFAENSESITGSLLTVPKSAADHIKQLSRYSVIFKRFYEPEKHNRLAAFLSRQEALDTLTVFPLLLYTYNELMPENIDEFDKILVLVESYLIRRMICGLTGKNYNRFFVDLIRVLDKNGVITAEAVADHMQKSSADTTRFPDDKSFHTAISDLPLYGRLAQYKVRVILEALDAFEQTSKSEVTKLPDGLTIEHVMPQKWQDHWPIPFTEKIDSQTGLSDPLVEQNAIKRRDHLINTLGNLTLITGSLNPALSHSAWDHKRPELLKYSKLNLTRYFHEAEADNWNDTAIEKRTAHLFSKLIRIWPELPVSNMLSDGNCCFEEKKKPILSMEK